jgi:hypothetical protein
MDVVAYITGYYMLGEIALSGLATFIAVCIMMVHGNADYDEPVPKILLVHAHALQMLTAFPDPFPSRTPHG